jgi:hypothetical protein
MNPVLSLYVGKKISVFDSKLWDKNGGDSKTDDFYREATIIKITGDSQVLLDVKFSHDGRISHGHFAQYIKEI